MSGELRELAADELWNPCDAIAFEFETTELLPGMVSIIGQDRAVQSIDFGVGIASHGFNIYAMGHPGTGRATSIHTFLNRVAADQPIPADWIYVYNFGDPNQPNAISLPDTSLAQPTANSTHVALQYVISLPLLTPTPGAPQCVSGRRYS